MAAKKKEKQAVNTGADLIDALNQIAKEKGIDKELIFETIEASLVSACKKNFGTSQNIKVVMNRDNGEVSVFAQKTVTQEVSDDILEISLEEARIINPAYNLDDVVDILVTPKNFGRIAAMAAKQVVVQKFKEAERSILYNEYITKEREVITGIVQRKEKKNYIITLGKIDAVLLPSEQIPAEELAFQSRVKVYVTEVKQTTKGPQINVSRTHPELVKRLFEQEVPEVHDGTVEIKSVSREAGSRTKMAVFSKREGVDPVGACVGPNGQRVNIIVGELRGEKIDIIKYSADPREYIAAALNPSKVLAVVVNKDDMTAKVVVPDHQLSLAIGKEGQNARLAAKLTGWRIDIKSESQARQTDFIDESEYLSFGDETRDAGLGHGKLNKKYSNDYEDDSYNEDDYNDGDYDEYDEGEYSEEDGYDDEYTEEDNYDDYDEDEYAEDDSDYDEEDYSEDDSDYDEEEYTEDDSDYDEDDYTENDSEYDEDYEDDEYDDYDEDDEYDDYDEEIREDD